MTTEEPKAEIEAPKSGAPEPKPDARRRQLRKIAGLLAGFAAAGTVLAGLTGYWTTYRTITREILAPVAGVDDKLARAPRLSLVVLPFANLSGDKEQDYFADGVTDDLTTDLSRIAGSFVIARNTAFTYKGKSVDAKNIGRELGVRYVMEGSVRRAGETITINAQLISTETGAHVWADRFDGERSNLGKLQFEIVARLARSLGVELTKAEALRVTRERPTNPDATDLVMRGWAIYNKGYSAANVNESLGYFERALQLEPDLVSAQLAVAGRLAERALAFAPDNASEDLARADAMVAKALSAEPDNPDPHVVKAQIMHVRHQFSEALAELRRVLDQNPNIAYLYSLYGLTLLFDGRTAEAIPQFETARRLSPRDPLQGLWEFQLCHSYDHLAQWEKAADWCEKSVATNPGLWLPYVDLAAADGWLGRDAQAKTAITELLKLRPGYTVQQWANEKFSDNPQFQREYVGIVEGLRKAGLPEQ